MTASGRRLSFWNFARLRLAARGLWPLAVAIIVACALPGAPPREEAPLRISDVSDDGDPVRRASLDLVELGLAADAAGDRRRASGLYARALQADSSNPYVYLALARHQVETGRYDRVEGTLARAEDLLRGTDALSPRAEVHVMGLRGAALRGSGRSVEGDALLSRAASLAPTVWGDGTLSAEELR